MWFVDISGREDMKYPHESSKNSKPQLKGLKGFSSVHTGFMYMFCELCKSVSAQT